MRRLEVAAQSPRAPLDSLPAPMLGELLEEVLDQVLLGQTLEHLDLLDRNRRLIGNRAGEIELAGSLGNERAYELVAGDERPRHASVRAAAARLWPELAQSDRPGFVIPERLGEATEQPVFLRVAQVKADSLGTEQFPRPPQDLRAEQVA